MQTVSSLHFSAHGGFTPQNLPPFSFSMFKVLTPEGSLRFGYKFSAKFLVYFLSLNTVVQIQPKRFSVWMSVMKWKESVTQTWRLSRAVDVFPTLFRGAWLQSEKCQWVMDVHEDEGKWSVKSSKHNSPVFINLVSHIGTCLELQLLQSKAVASLESKYSKQIFK